ncbi:serine/threonine-protein kinase HAL4/sat4 [Borealophlyctis nickersoniae]|nr:serine/threonine-protein kinase HAL4/sat4 [Borealophlyctis nickersoniae]
MSASATDIGPERRRKSEKGEATTTRDHQESDESDDDDGIMFLVTPATPAPKRPAPSANLNPIEEGSTESVTLPQHPEAVVGPHLGRRVSGLGHMIGRYLGPDMGFGEVWKGEKEGEGATADDGVAKGEEEGRDEEEHADETDEHPALHPPSTYIYSPAFSTPGRKHTLIQRIFHAKSTSDEEIVVSRPSSPQRAGYKHSTEEVDRTHEPEDRDHEKDKAPEAGSDVVGVVHLLHYPGSLHRDHALPSPRPVSRTESLISKLLHLHKSDDGSVSPDPHRSSTTTPPTPRSRDELHHASTPSPRPPSTTTPNRIAPSLHDSPCSDTPPQEPGGDRFTLFRTKSTDRKPTHHGTNNNNNNHPTTTTLTNNTHPDDHHVKHNLFKELLGTRHKRAASHSVGSASGVVELDEGQGGAGGERPAIARSHSETSMANKYGHVTQAQKHEAAQSEKLYAIKEFRKRRKDETQREYVKKLISEFCISSNMKHENVIETVDLIQDEQRNKWCQVMEYMAGGDLYNHITQGDIVDADEINCLFKQLLNGVAYLHSVGVSHRDLKPENLLLDAQNRILKITDFGGYLADECRGVSQVFRTCFEKAPRKLKGLCGSEPYIAPEEWEGGEYESTKVDVWACGIIYYSMLFRSVPWRVARPSDHYYQEYLKRRRPNGVKGYSPFDRLPPGPRNALYHILDPDPDTRWDVTRLLADSWMAGVECCHLIAPGVYAPVSHKHHPPGHTSW